MTLAAKFLYADSWKEKYIPTLEEWSLKVMQLAIMTK